MGQIKFIGGIILTSLFCIAFITFAIQFGTDNGTSFTLDNETITTKNNMVSSLTVWHSDINKSSKSFSESEIQEQETFKTGGQFKGGAVSSMNLVKSNLILGFSKIFGSDNSFSILLNALIGFLSLVSLLYIYKTWVGRNPD